MSMYEGFLPEKQAEGKLGYYPVTSAQEWNDLPKAYKAMEWFPVKMSCHGYEETTVAEYIEFDVVYMEPYKISATVRVHVQEVQKILFCAFQNAQCHLYSVSGVVFKNGERWNASWKQDSCTGSFAIYASGKQIGMQGGYLGFIPNNIERTEDGGFKINWNMKGNRTHYQLGNPFD